MATYGLDLTDIAVGGTVIVTSARALQNITDGSFTGTVTINGDLTGVVVTDGTYTGRFRPVNSVAGVQINSSGILQIVNASAERARFDADGRLLVGTTSVGSVTAGGARLSGVTQIDAALIVGGTTSYLRVPGLNTTQRDALTAANGMIIYNETTGIFQGRAAGAWVDFHA